MEIATSSSLQDDVSNRQECAHTSIQMLSLPINEEKAKAKVKEKEKAKVEKEKEKIKAEKVKEKVERVKARSKVTKKGVAKVTEEGLNEMRTVNLPEEDHRQVNSIVDCVPTSKMESAQPETIVNFGTQEYVMIGAKEETVFWAISANFSTLVERRSQQLRSLLRKPRQTPALRPVPLKKRQQRQLNEQQKLNLMQQKLRNSPMKPKFDKQPWAQ
jgi:hypothetical protein